MLIDGEWVEAADGGAFDVVNPATEEVFARAALATEADVAGAVDAADRAFAGWSRLSPAQRAAYLCDAADLVVERHEEIGRLMTQEQGKPLQEAQGEVLRSADTLRYYAEEGQRAYGRIIAGAGPQDESRVVYEPVGPAAGISPWNYPVSLLAYKVGAALAAGCTLVAKPPSLTPLSPLAFLRCLTDADLPPGVVNAVTGPGTTVGRQLIADPRIKKVAFTGSTEAGRQVLADCAKHMKKVALELGGHCPLIVCADADIESALSSTMSRKWRNAGQICIAVNRVYVQREVHDEFVERFVEATRKVVIGNGLERVPCNMGPMADADGLAKTQRHVADALAKGAALACGGKRPDGEEFARGYFYEPTILTNVTHDMLVMTEETFGPVVGIMAFGSLDEAISLANDTPYGLAAYAFTRDLDDADRLCRELQAGNVAINTPNAGALNAPYGGWKASGMGHEHGPEGLHEYLRPKHVRVVYPNRGN